MEDQASRTDRDDLCIRGAPHSREVRRGVREAALPVRAVIVINECGGLPACPSTNNHVVPDGVDICGSAPPHTGEAHPGAARQRAVARNQSIPSRSVVMEDAIAYGEYICTRTPPDGPQEASANRIRGPGGPVIVPERGYYRVPDVRIPWVRAYGEDVGGRGAPNAGDAPRDGKRSRKARCRLCGPI